MDKDAVYSTLDYTLLKQFADKASIDALCKKALEYKTASVCIPPSYVPYVRETFPTLIICTVIGFPNGYNTKAVKVYETKEAIKDGADEIDMVINITDVKNGLFDKVTDEIREIKKAAGDHILKVIVETCFLTQEEKKAVCRCVSEAGADYIKTSTGFGTKGAEIEDITLFRENIDPGVKIKAAGGIRSLDSILAFLDRGASRIGTSLDPEKLFVEE